MVPARIASVQELDDLVSLPDEAVCNMLRRETGRVMVIGAGGKMGFHLSLMLQKGLKRSGRNGRVITVSRFSEESIKRQFLHAEFDVVSADASSPEEVSRLPEAELVFFLAGVKFGTSSRSDLLHRMNVLMPRLIAERYSGSKIVALSTGCVYSFTRPESGGSREESPADPPGDYAMSCLQREQAFVTGSAEYGTPVSLIRLNYSVETRYGVLVDVAQKVLAGEPVDVTMGYVNVIWQGDALRHIVESLGHASSPPFVLNVTGTEILRVRDLAEGFARRFHTTARFVGEEASTAWLNNAVKSHRLFGPPTVSVDQMMDWIADWLQQGLPTLSKPTHFEIRRGGY